MDIRGDDETANNATVFIYDGANVVPDDVTHVRVDPSVTTIPECVFWSCHNLLEVKLPEGLTEIERWAFSDCCSLKRINFPSTLQEIGFEAFGTCAKLEDVILPMGLIKLGDYAFVECNSLKSINIPPNFTMDLCVFLDCEGLTDVSFSEGVQTISKRAFDGCKSLVSTTLPSSLTVIEEMAFEDCESLCTLNLPDTVEAIGAKAFRNTGLQNFRVPPRVTSFDMSMISECHCLVSIELLERVRRSSSPGTVLTSLRNIALPSDCTVVLTDCNSLDLVFPDDEDGGTISDALKQRFDDLPIHKICYYQSYHPRETVLRDLRREANPWTSKFPGQLNATGGQQDCLGMTPLHIVACSTRQDIEVYRLLISKYPETLITKDKWGDIPLLYALWCNAPDEVVVLLAESYKSYHPEYEFDWQGMLRTLLKACIPLANIQKLVCTQQTSFPDQMFDIKTALIDQAESEANLERGYTPIKTVRYLLSVSIAKRLEILNVDRWRVEIENSINMLPEEVEDNQKQNTMDVYAKLELYELAKEAASVLELALWKRKINDSVPSLSYSGRKRARVDEDISQRNQCRINCGADIIIPGVLDYLVPQLDNSPEV